MFVNVGMSDKRCPFCTVVGTIGEMLSHHFGVIRGD